MPALFRTAVIFCRHGPKLSVVVSVAALVFCLAVATAALGHLTGHITGIWVANAVWLAFLLKHRTRHWVVLIAAGFAGNLASDLFAGYAILPTVYMCACNAIEVLIVAAPMRTFELDREFARPKSLLTFYALAIGPAPVISALLVSTAFHATYGTDFVTSSMNWYAADALGLSIVVPPLMTVHAQALKAMFRREQIFETLLLVGVVLGAVVINVVARDYPLAFLFFPAVVLLTFQRGFAGGAIGLLLTASYLLEPVLFGHTVGAIKLYPTREKIIIVQIFIAVTGFSVMLVGAALEQRRKAEKSLAAAMARMES